MQEQVIQHIMQQQREFFSTGRSKELAFRMNALQKLKASILSHEQEILDALHKDLHKPLAESYTSEIGPVIQEINHALKKCTAWAKRESVRSNWLDIPSRSYILKEPYGVVLIIGPWNYPFQLTLVPLIGAIAAGNCCVLKPSEISAASSAVLTQVIREAFDESYIAVIGGGVESSQSLLRQTFNKIFFTGSPAVGRIVMEQAAAHLTPVTLELGGKSPCIVDATAEVEVTARRILWGKFFNAGQTCIAPDYLLVHREIKQALYDAFRSVLRQFFTDNPAASPDFARVINKNHFTRLSRYIQDGRLIAGGQTDEAGLYIAPTIIEVTSLDTAVMQEEIFGPILPVLEYTSLDEVVQMVGNNPDPLAFYVFSRDKQTVQMLLNSVPFGGGCVNDTLSHIQNHALPFGGRGSSGMGSYHGIFSFNAFSHRKSVVHKGFRFDFAMKYPPYRNSHAFLRKFFLK